jgi:protein associated with RNAse G/E
MYRGMTGAPGSFSDFFIWRDTVEDRRKANARFDAMAWAMCRWWRVQDPGGVFRLKMSPLLCTECGMMLAEGSAVHVRKLRPDGSQAFAWDGVVLRCDESGIVLRAQFNVDLVDLGFTTFRRGDEFIEFYYWDRWYNVFQVSSPDGTLKGWYANVGLPAELRTAAGELVYVDLELDVWAQPDGEFIVLDQDEFDTLLTEHVELVEAAERGRETLLALAEARRLPRWTDVTAAADTVRTD